MHPYASFLTFGSRSKKRCAAAFAGSIAFESPGAVSARGVELGDGVAEGVALAEGDGAGDSAVGVALGVADAAVLVGEGTADSLGVGLGDVQPATPRASAAAIAAAATG